MRHQLARIVIDLDAATRRSRLRIAADIPYPHAAAARFKLLPTPHAFQLDRTAAGVEPARHFFRCVHHEGDAGVVAAEPS